MKINNSYIIAGLTLAAPLSTFAATCSTSVTNGGLSGVTLTRTFTPSEWGTNNGWSAIAKEVQRQYGNRLAHDTPTGQVHIRFNVRVGLTRTLSAPGPMPPLLIDFSGKKSIEKEILDQRGIDKGKADPNPCSGPGPTKSQTTATSGGGSTGGSGSTTGTGGGSSGTYVYAPVGYTSADGGQTWGTTYGWTWVPNNSYSTGA